ncbi:hypothetical protein [Pyramidobacter piscolens]|uniref:hypothetical protein n=1 Tax=Pyramidobacter piscolens TaxID=638849 RepID=UPI002AB1AABB|nr:hypothetical protein [Pyramidobacter piscolens]
MSEFIGTTEAAAILAARFGAYSPHTVKNLAQRGKIPGAQKIARNWLIPLEWAKTYKKTRS